MINIKTSSIVAGLTFILSLLIGIISRTSFPTLILRPLIFGVFFFLFSGLISLLVVRFLPELLEEKAKVKEPDLIIPGSTINITEETPAIPAVVPGMVYAAPDDSSEDMDDFSQLTNRDDIFSNSAPVVQSKPDPVAIDQTEKTGYTKEGEPASSSEGGNSFNGLPDLEGLVGAFMPVTPGKDEEVEVYSSSEPSQRPIVGNKPHKMDKDFHPKELAEGIRTVLKKEEG